MTPFLKKLLPTLSLVVASVATPTPDPTCAHNSTTCLGSVIVEVADSDTVKVATVPDGEEAQLLQRFREHPLGEKLHLAPRKFNEPVSGYGARAIAACPNPVEMTYGFACECSGTSCGKYPDPSEIAADEAMIITSTAQFTVSFMDPKIVKTRAEQPAEWNFSKIQMDVDLSETYQQIIGFGGAFTDAVAYHYQEMNRATQKQFIEQYFGLGGIGYTVGRVPMNAADFSRMNYALDNVTDDFDLEHFCLRDDSARDAPCGTDYKTTVIKAALDAIIAAGASKLKLFVSSWSPPLWYKNQSFNCKLENAMWVCNRAPPPPAMNCTVAVLNPQSCIGNAQGQPCPTEPLPKTWVQDTQALGTDAVLISSSELQVVHAAQAASASGKSYSSDFIRQSGTPSYPTDNAHGNCFNTGFLRQSEKHQRSWALFFSKFIGAYNKQGIDIWGVTVQNEPLATRSEWQAMYYTSEIQAQFVANHLGPMLRDKHPGVKLMIHDDQTTDLLSFAGAILRDPEATRYVDGVGYHWYKSLQGTYENGPAQPVLPFVDNLVNGGAYVKDIWEELQKQSNDKFVLSTEACAGYVLGTGWVGPRPGSWGYGYSYAHDILWQLRNRGAGWTDWNLMLGMDGGPNLAGNYVDAPILRKDSNTFIQNPMFFHLAHFSKYLVPGSKQVKLDIKCHAWLPEWCQAVGFLRPDGKVVVVLTNDEITVGPIAKILATPWLPNPTGPGAIIVPALAKGQGTSLSWTLRCGGKEVSGSIQWNSIQTIIFECKK